MSHSTLDSVLKDPGFEYQWGAQFIIVAWMYANLAILATPVPIIGHQVVCLGHLGGFVAF